MSQKRLKKRNFNVSIFNIKISPKKNNENFKDLYADLIKKLYIHNSAINTRADKWMEMRTQSSYDNDKILYGKLIYYTMLEGNDWYNKRDKSIQEFEFQEPMFPNVKEIEYFFIPDAHRFCVVNKSNGIALSQVHKFLLEALPTLLEEDKIVTVTQEVSSDIIRRIIEAPKIYKLEVDISYSNNDLSSDFEEFFDNDLREGQVQSFSMVAKSYKRESIELDNSKILKAALNLSQSNGHAEAIIENEHGRNEKISTIEYPRKENISTHEGSEHIDIFSKIMSIFRNGKK